MNKESKTLKELFVPAVYTEDELKIVFLKGGFFVNGKRCFEDTPVENIKKIRYYNVPVL